MTSLHRWSIHFTEWPFTLGKKWDLFLHFVLIHLILCTFFSIAIKTKSHLYSLNWVTKTQKLIETKLNHSHLPHLFEMDNFEWSIPYGKLVCDYQTEHVFILEKNFKCPNFFRFLGRNLKKFHLIGSFMDFFSFFHNLFQKISKKTKLNIFLTQVGSYHPEFIFSLVSLRF